MAGNTNKKASDFRYNTGETRVPWAAVGENYNAEDVMAVIRFMMQGKGEEYDRILENVRKDIFALDKISEPPAKLSLDNQVGRAEKLCDEICIIKHGELLYQGTLDDLKATHKSQASLENIFLELTDTKDTEVTV